MIDELGIKSRLHRSLTLQKLYVSVFLSDSSRCVL